MERVASLRQLLDTLGRAGLWSGIPHRRRRAITNALRAGADVTWTAGGAWWADGEDLAEGEVETWLSGMAEPLSQCGLSLSVATITGPADGKSPGYALRLNGTRVDLYHFVDGQPGLPATVDPWTDCTVRPVAVVNRLLRAAGSDHRIAVFWPGTNDGLAVLGPENTLRQATTDFATTGSDECVLP